MPLITYDKLLYLSLFFARGSALFFLSPLFVERKVPLYVRFALLVVSSLFLFSHFPKLDYPTLLPIPLLLIKEFIVGYLLGTLFAFFIEGALLAGRWFGSLAGFSATEFLDPSHNSNQPLFARFFWLLVTAFLLACDFHHLFAYCYLDSFSLIPIDALFASKNSFLSLSESAQYLFNQGFSYIALPLFILLALLIAMAFISKIYPEIPIFWLGFSIQIITGLVVLACLMLFIAPLVEKAVVEILELSSTLFY